MNPVHNRTDIAYLTMMFLIKDCHDFMLKENYQRRAQQYEATRCFYHQSKEIVLFWLIIDSSTLQHHVGVVLVSVPASVEVALLVALGS